MSAESNAGLARAVCEAFNTRDFEACLAPAADDVESVTVASGQISHGRDEWRRSLEGWTTCAPDCRIDITRQLAGEDGVTNEYILWGTQTGPLQTVAGTVAPTGRSFSIPCCGMWRMIQGKLVSMHEYFDMNTLLQQLGVLPQWEHQRAPDWSPPPSDRTATATLR